MDASFILRFVLYAAASLGTGLLIVTLIVTSWVHARPRDPDSPSRLRWHMITRSKITKGTQVKASDVTWRLGRVAARDPLIPISKTVIGKYALRDIDANSSCIPEVFSDLALADPPQGGAVVPIEVKTSDVSSLRPGMQLAFVQQDKGVQPVTTLLSKQNQPGLRLLSMTASVKEPGATTLLVEINKSDVGAAPLLVTGVWRPVILGAPEPVVAPEQKKPIVNTRKAPTGERSSRKIRLVRLTCVAKTRSRLRVCTGSCPVGAGSVPVTGPSHIKSSLLDLRHDPRDRIEGWKLRLRRRDSGKTTLLMGRF